MMESGNGHDEDEAGPRVPPPTQEQVAYRALCLHATVIRAELEALYHLCRENNVPAAEVDGLQQRVAALGEWLTSEGVRAQLSPMERDSWFATALGQWEQQAVLDGSWRKESLGVLLWALSVLPKMPPYDTEFEAQVHVKSVGWLQPAAGFLARVRLRLHVEIERARNVAELWRWRARTTQAQQLGVQPPPGLNFPKLIRLAAETGHRQGDLPRPIKHDFPAFGRPYARLTDEQYSLAMSIARERHHALNWLCGYSEDWDSMPTET